jgi:hypothetical protein
MIPAEVAWMGAGTNPCGSSSGDYMEFVYKQIFTSLPKLHVKRHIRFEKLVDLEVKVQILLKCGEPFKRIVSGRFCRHAYN